MAVEVYRLYRVKLKQASDALLALWSPIFPECVAQPCPCLREAFLIRIGVLNDKPLQCIGIACNDSEAYWASVILGEEAVMIEFPLLQEFRGDFSEPFKGVGKLQRIGHVAIAEARIIRGDEVKAVGEHWYQVSILMR